MSLNDVLVAVDAITRDKGGRTAEGGIRCAESMMIYVWGPWGTRLTVDKELGNTAA